ncbi:M20 family metallopeptidase [Paenibacillus periandrae]|uniref:M20 family metallopeptidase n=1 Tax=Paenibacillus periandrae TaxID=1761741 RepID=UPI001F09B0CE|nr:M20 family metallopeptidase [Paenibacillus periandrae]
METTQRISEIVELKRELFIEVSDKIWDYAETRFEEFKSAELICSTLENEGFQVERGAAGIQTAFIGSYGSGNPVVAILGEFDALSGLSQQRGSSNEEPIVQGGNGHGCGHNLLGSGALAAAVSLRYYMEENNIPGTVRYYGCPAEEGGSGKTFMAREGLFNDIDFAICWHPDTHNFVMSMSTLANYQIYYKFKGKSAHAAVSPQLGRSALDAVELMNVGTNYLREHIIPEARMHYAVLNTGGLSPNVVQAEAEVLYLIRAPRISQVNEIYNRVCNIAQGAALMTGTEVKIVFDKACSNLISNTTIEKVMHKNFTELGVPIHDENELKLAEEVRSRLTETEKYSDRNMQPELRDKALSDRLNPYIESTQIFAGSTDVGDVSWIAPTAQCSTACFVNGSQAHSWQWVTLGGTSIGHKGMLHAGKVMAATAAEVMQNPQLIKEAKEELKKRLGEETYVNPIPLEVRPSAKK